MAFSNVYDDPVRAAAYAALDYPGTYYLAYRDLPEIIRKHVTGKRALDFGCGAGRSTRFLRRLGFETIGIDISSSMIEFARSSDTAGEYVLVQEGDLSALRSRRFDLIFSGFAFDNIPDIDNRTALLKELRGHLEDDGTIILLGSTPDIYRNEWVSFTTKDFPENRLAKSGQPVRIVMKDVTDARPVVDIVWSHDDYLKLLAAVQLDLVAFYRPLGRDDEPVNWISETTIAPWIIYVAKRSSGESKPSPA